MVELDDFKTYWKQYRTLRIKDPVLYLLAYWDSLTEKQKIELLIYQYMEKEIVCEDSDMYTILTNSVNNSANLTPDKLVSNIETETND